MPTRRGWLGWVMGLVLAYYSSVFGGLRSRKTVTWVWFEPYSDSNALGWIGWYENTLGQCTAFVSVDREVMYIENPEHFHRYDGVKAAESGWLGHWSAEGDPCTALLDLDGCVVPFGALGKIRKHRRLERVRY